MREPGVGSVSGVRLRKGRCAGVRGLGEYAPFVKQERNTVVKMGREHGTMRYTLMSVIAVASLLLILTLIPAEEEQSDATLTLHTISIADGVGYSWGAGVLTFQGKTYPFRVEGISIGDMGVSRAEATGTVYHLTTIDDFSGDYVAFSTSAAIARGSGVATMRNRNGVVIDLTGIDQGLKLKFAVEGVKITVEGAETALQGK
jgi:outer membrane immunogenic protein